MYKLIKQGFQYNDQVKFYICDTVDDLDKIPLDKYVYHAIGDEAYVIDTSEYYIKDRYGKWCLKSVVGSDGSNVDNVDIRYNPESENAQSGKAVAEAVSDKQDSLVSGTNIKTINNQSILGSGNITIEGGSDVEVDQNYNPESENAQSGKAVAEAISATPITDQNSRLDEEIISANGWTLDGWTGNLTSGFAHTVGSTGRLTYTLGNTGTKLYYLEFDVTSPTGAGTPNASTAFTVTIGNSPRFIAYDGGGSKHYAFGIKSVENGNLEFIPTGITDCNIDEGTFDGTISNISLKEIIAVNEPTTVLKDVEGNIYEEKRILYNSSYIGKESGKNALNGSELNIAFGDYALQDNTTGYWNTAMGCNTLKFNTVGSRNVAIGKMALEGNVSGDRNIGIGSFALCRNKNGRNNIGIGADALWNNTSGENNIAIGLASLGENKTGKDNIAIGYGVLTTETNDYNIAIGGLAMGDAKNCSQCIAIGYRALSQNQKSGNLAIGFDALRKNVTGTNNFAIGSNSLKQATGSMNMGLGIATGEKVTSGYGNMFIGLVSGSMVTTGWSNTFIGHFAGDTVTTGYNNILIGYEADANATVHNAIVIGKGVTATKNYSVIIGSDSITETLLKGNLIVRGTDGIKRQITFDTDGSCSWVEVT